MASTASTSSARCLAFLGSDEGLSSAAAHAAYLQLTADSEGWGDEIIDGAAPNVDEALRIIQRTISGLQMVNMFGGGKTIWLRGVTFMGDSPQGTKSQAVLDALDTLLSCLENLPEGTYFCLQAMEVDKRRSFYKKLTKIARIEEYSKIDISRQGWERELAQFVTRLARERALSLSPEAMDLFVHRVHENSRQIANELDKLAVYLGRESRRLEVADIELMVPVSRKGVIYEISRALERGNAASAIALVDAQLESGESAIAIIRAAFIPTLSNRYRASLLLARHQVDLSSTSAMERSLEQLPPSLCKLIPSKKDGTPNYYGFYQHARDCSKLSPKKALRALRACAEADKQLVSTSIDPRVLLHRLVIACTL